jgi:hypothetical protein
MTDPRQPICPFHFATITDHRIWSTRGWLWDSGSHICGKPQRLQTYHSSLGIPPVCIPASQILMARLQRILLGSSWLIIEVQVLPWSAKQSGITFLDLYESQLWQAATNYTYHASPGTPQNWQISHQNTYTRSLVHIIFWFASITLCVLRCWISRRNALTSWSILTIYNCVQMPSPARSVLLYRFMHE